MHAFGARIRAALAAAGGTAAQGRVVSHVAQRPPRPFAESALLEGPTMRAHAVGAPEPMGGVVGFVDGTQRYVVAGYVGITPVVHAVVAAAAVERTEGNLRTVADDREEFLVVPGGRLNAHAQAALTEVGLPIHEGDTTERPHPILDQVLCGEAVERRRVRCEHGVSRRFQSERPAAWFLVDGSLGDLADGAPRTVGVIKSHDTQFLDGHDLHVVCTLAPGERSSVFQRPGAPDVHTWYLRLWPWDQATQLHGLIRVEASRTTDPGRISRWLLTERTPIADDARWDRLLYPMHRAEAVLRARLGGWQ